MPRGSKTKKGVAGPLSNSSAKTLMTCEQKYVHYKVKHTPKDSDYVKSDALSIGSAVHYCVESNKWNKPKLSDALKHCVEGEDIQLAHENRELVAAMALELVAHHKTTKMKVLEVEFELKTDEFIGYVDALMEDEEGEWWIVDLKTARTLDTKGLPALPRDTQLNLYAYFKDTIADMFNLDANNFGGCRWRVCTKPSLKRRIEEIKEDGSVSIDYIKRLRKSTKVYDVKIPVVLLDTEGTYARHHDAFLLSKKMFKPSFKPKKNFAACMNYFKPCEYFSHCHGMEYSKIERPVVTEYVR